MRLLAEALDDFVAEDQKVLRAEDTYDAVIAAALDYIHRCSLSGPMMLAA